MAKKKNGEAAAAATSDTATSTATVDEKPAEKAPAAPRVLKGDAAKGVRAHPSYDHPGQFYMVEASSRKRVWNGYHTVEEIIAHAKEQGWEFLGVVDVRGKGKGDKEYNKPSVAAAIEAHGRFVRKTAEKPAAEDGAETSDVKETAAVA